jgi:hypothetical protein
MRYGQGLASTQWQQDFNNRNQLAQYGLQGAQGAAQAQSGYADNMLRSAFGRSGIYEKRGEAIAGQYGSLFGALDNSGLDSMFGFGGGGGLGGSTVEAKGFMPSDFKLAGATNWLPGGF